MGNRLIILVIVALLFLPSWVLALDSLYPAKIEKVIDGDTIMADLSLGLGVILDDQYIRLYGINAWEIKGKERERGVLAKEYLERKLQKGEVEIEIKPGWGRNGRGKYGRWLGRVYVNGKDINAELIEKDHAREYEEN
ncbi:hypothetical protein ES702_01038 [subsurface metagenome]